MPPQKPAASNKQSWLILFFALTFSVVFYGLMSFFIGQSSKPRPISPLLATLRPFAVLALIAALAWLRFKIDGKSAVKAATFRFRRASSKLHSLVALALSEACCIAGLPLFFLGAPLTEFGFFAAGTLFVDFSFVLPRGMTFWANQSNS